MPALATPISRTHASQLTRAIGNLARRVRQTRTSGGLSWTESSALLSVIQHGPATSAELARIEGITPQSMGNTYAALERAGYVERGTDAADGRRILLSATARGRELQRERADARAEQFTRVLAAEFDDGEFAQLMAAIPLLDRLADRIHIDAHELREGDA